MAHNDLRTMVNGFFRQGWKFFFIFVPIVSAGLVYVMLATPEYESTAKLLVKFGQDARPEITDRNESSSADEHREMVQSNVNILTSRDLMRSLLQDMTVERVYPKIAAVPPAHGTVMDAAIKRFGDDLVVKTENESDIIGVGLYNPDPEMAQTLLHKLIDLFIARQSDVYANPQTAVLRDQARTARSKLETAQKRLYAYKNSSGIVSMEEQLTLLLKQRNDLDEELLNKERLYSHYKSAYGNRPEDPEVTELRAQAGALDKQIASTSQRKARYDDLSREIELDENNYEQAQSRAQEAEANQSLNQAKITHISVIEQPALPYKATRPMKSLIIAFSVFIGLALGCSLSIIAESFDQSFSQPDQVARKLGIPVLATFAYRTAGGRVVPKKRLRKS